MFEGRQSQMMASFPGVSLFAGYTSSTSYEEQINAPTRIHDGFLRNAKVHDTLSFHLSSADPGLHCFIVGVCIYTRNNVREQASLRWISAATKISARFTVKARRRPIGARIAWPSWSSTTSLQTRRGTTAATCTTLERGSTARPLTFVPKVCEYMTG